MITRERAVELVEGLLVARRRGLPGHPVPAVHQVAEHEFGWLVFWQSTAYLETGAIGTMLVGHGPYVVADEGVFSLGVVEFMTGAWEQAFREHVRGEEPPDPVFDDVRATLGRDGLMAALRCLRRRAPQLRAVEAKAYVDALRAGRRPDDSLRARAREPREEPSPLRRVDVPPRI